jgi:hypothetical protein
MRRTTVQAGVLLGLLLIPDTRPLLSDRRPRIWLTPAVLSSLRAKAASGDADWLRLKARADELLSRRMPRFTVNAVSNTNPARFDLAEPVTWPASTPVFIAGATGAWAAVNTAGDRPEPLIARRVAPRAFTVPVDSTAFGAFDGQRVVLFFNEGASSAYGYGGADWQTAFEALGIAYQVTGNAAYASTGLELIDYLASLGAAGMVAPAAIDSGFPSRSAVYGLAVGYDWLHDRLTADQKSAVAQTVNLWFDWFTRAAFENEGPAYGNYFGGHLLGFGLAAVATAGDNPRAGEIAAHIRRLFDLHVRPAFASGGFAGGYPVEGHPYGAHHFQRLLSYMLAIDTATGSNLVGETGYARTIARSLLYQVKPNGWQVGDEASSPGDYTGVLSPSLPLVLSELLADTAEGRWMQQLATDLAGARRPGVLDDPFVRLLFFNRARPAEDHRTRLPTWHRSPGDEHVFRRGSWGPEAVWTSIAAGVTHWSGHQMRGAGHIALQRGDDYLLVNSGQWKGVDGVSGTPQAFDLRSWRANTLFVNDFGDYLFTGADYRGGQGYWGLTRVLASGGGPDFAYVKTDLTSAYSVGKARPWENRSVRLFHRSVVTAGDGVVVLFDRMRFRKADYVKKLFFHLNPVGGPPLVAGNTALVRAGRSALFIRALLPDAPVLDVAVDPISDDDRRPSTYRLEISDSVSRRTFDALTVLVATARSAPSMPPAVRLRTPDGTVAGAMVSDGRARRIVTFSASGDPLQVVRYTAPYPAGQNGLHVVTDLVPGTTYDIWRGDVRLGVERAATGGVVTFDCNGGGAFIVRSRAAAETQGLDWHRDVER